MDKLTTLPKEEIYKYLGYQKKTQVLSDTINTLVDLGIQEILNVAEPKVLVSSKMALHTKESDLYAEDLHLEGTDIEAHLKNCKAIILFAITLGTAVDARIRTAEMTDMVKAVVLDSVANVAIEQYADMAEAELRKSILSQNQYLTMRFSPGYGDLPIAMQKDIFRILDAQKKIGLTLTPSNLMIPRKSITAILGVADVPVKGKLASCTHCVLKGNCSYRKRGVTCFESN